MKIDNQWATGRCLDLYLKGKDDNAFHTLRELGEESISELRSRFSTASVESKIKMLVLAREIRAPSASLFLIDAATEQQTAVWKAALEGLAYQQCEGVLTRLRELLSEAVETHQVKKSDYISDLIHSAPEWIVTRHPDGLGC